MKKGQKVNGKVIDLKFPNKGVVLVEETEENQKKQILFSVKNALPDQAVSIFVKKMRKGAAEGILAEVIENAPYARKSPCPHFGMCGGCLFQEYPYEAQLRIKEEEVCKLLQPVWDKASAIYEDILPLSSVFEGVIGSPNEFGYRNKMEYTFGDEEKDGPLSLGMHKRNSFYDVVSVPQCQIADSDFGQILSATLSFMDQAQIPFFHRLHHTGYLRHLCIRKAAKTGEILVNLVTTSNGYVDGKAYMDCLLSLQLKGEIVGILHTLNDSVADVVKKDSMDIMFGRDFFYEELLGMKFKITPFSFFQTNSLGAEVLYEVVRTYLGDISSMKKDNVVFDLYSGTGTIAQLMSPAAGSVVGVEIVEEAVEAARINAKINHLDNCKFLAGDVLKILDEIEEKPDTIILDPPRDGVHPKALQKIVGYGVEKIVYVSCKPSSLARDLEVFFGNGYRVKKVCCVDMFPATANVETVVALHRTNS